MIRSDSVLLIIPEENPEAENNLEFMYSKVTDSPVNYENNYKNLFEKIKTRVQPSGCLVINLFGVPSAGKSTGAAYIFSKLKMKGINAELVTEFAKDKVWEDNSEVFKPDNQCYIFGKQFYRMSRCKDKVDVIITDSPLPLCILYNKSRILGDEFNQVVMNCFNSFINLSWLVLRDRPYNPIGRIHTEEQSDALKKPLVELLDKHYIEYAEIKGNQEEYDKLINFVYTLIKNR